LSQDAAAKINAILSKRLAQEREHRGISKKSLAALADIDRSTVKFIEDEEENPTILNLIRYGLALKLDVGKLLSDCLIPHLADEGQKEAKSKKLKK
jgi:DNA-binding XRE family transcriptional regulator